MSIFSDIPDDVLKRMELDKADMERMRKDLIKSFAVPFELLSDKSPISPKSFAILKDRDPNTKIVSGSLHSPGVVNQNKMRWPPIKAAFIHRRFSNHWLNGPRLTAFEEQRDLEYFWQIRKNVTVYPVAHLPLQGKVELLEPRLTTIPWVFQEKHAMVMHFSFWEMLDRKESHSPLYITLPEPIECDGLEVEGFLTSTEVIVPDGVKQHLCRWEHPGS